MKRNVKSVLCFMLVALMVLTILVGCNQTKVDTPDPTTTKAPVTTEPEVVEKEVIQMIVHLWNAVDSQLNPESETWKKIVKDILDKTKVEVVVKHFEWADGRMQMNLHAASKDLPAGMWRFPGYYDMYYANICNEMGEAGLMHDLTPFIEDTANYPNLKANAEELFLDMFKNKNNGKQYVFPSERHRSFPHAPGGIAVRADWLKQTGLAYPTNQDELYNLIKTFKDTIKDDAGKPVFPVSFNENLIAADNFHYWLNSWLGTGHWYKNDSGAYDFGKFAKTAQLEEALAFLNRLWRENLLDKETFSHLQEQFISKGATGKIGITGYSYGGIYSINDSLQQQYPGSESYFVSMPPISCYEGLDVKDVMSCEIVSTPTATTVITSDIPEGHLERYMEVLDYIGSHEAGRMVLMGFEGEHWEKNKDGKVVRSQKYMEATATNWAWPYKEGITQLSSLNANPKALYELLDCIVTKGAEIISVTNIKGRQVSIFDPINIAVIGPVQTEKWAPIEQAWIAMVIDAVSASSEAASRKIVKDWGANLNKLGYQDVVKERTEAANAMTK